jgi:hypothetical protein
MESSGAFDLDGKVKRGKREKKRGERSPKKKKSKAVLNFKHRLLVWAFG